MLQFSHIYCNMYEFTSIHELTHPVHFFTVLGLGLGLELGLGLGTGLRGLGLGSGLGLRFGSGSGSGLGCRSGLGSRSGFGLGLENTLDSYGPNFRQAEILPDSVEEERVRSRCIHCTSSTGVS